ncbi:hypothetical protein Q4511_15830 [Paracoccus sp. 1_MG-2023]|uniref:hypothetical protein n=1 Tax=unclassified Paracoccus (in: a-proteobacteria) TaxID=2688777 RepID=UPI001C082ADB|nr:MULTISPECIES: hypothetical protein [unclassified Paracoccus (in: a-proteobacteria)]MBU2956125.1 hypothetical protein [Paracoccus sp. C2R09]MDO6670387.1 hypothetical protein [Paracoccus sp. 1_MG-2023]
MKKQELGICRLTLARGKFVKSHIIPKALTPRDVPGSLMFQSDGHERPKKRFDSWYDQRLVIRKGEDILASIDDDAIKEIQRLKLAWKYWDDQSELSMEPFRAGAAVGVRSLINVNHVALAKLAISILWRAGASEMEDFKNFLVSETLLEQARLVVIGHHKFDPTVFPIKVFQFGTKGPLHNLTPMNHELSRADGAKEKFFRIFANGLFFHVTDTTSSQPDDIGKANWYLRASGKLDVLCMDFEKSAQNEFATSVFSHFASQQSSSGKQT